MREAFPHIVRRMLQSGYTHNHIVIFEIPAHQPRVKVLQNLKLENQKMQQTIRVSSGSRASEA